MDKKYKAVLLSCFAASALMFPGNVSYGEESINTFKNVAGDAEEIRSQYKERLDKLSEKQYLNEVNETIHLNNMAAADNLKEQDSIKKSIEEISQKQRDNANWLVQNKQMIDRRAPELNSLTDHEERMQYLDKEIADCEKIIAEKERRVRSYETQSQALQGQYVDNEQLEYGGASFNERKQAVQKALNDIQYMEDRLEEADYLKNKMLQGKDGAAPAENPQADQNNSELDKKIAGIEANASQLNAQLEEQYRVQQDLYAIRDRVEAEHDLAQEKAELSRWYDEVKNDSLRISYFQVRMRVVCID